jgi:pimeloyl-ACP methyl ester carboxylesterase
VLAHGWEETATGWSVVVEFFGRLGFTTIMHSARDHGKSSTHHFMCAPRFAEDIEAVLRWVEEPVLLYGHSIGATAAVIAASRNPGQVKLLFLEGCYAKTREALLSLYRSYNWVFGVFFAPMVILWMEIFWKWGLEKSARSVLQPKLMPVLIIHGEGSEFSSPSHGGCGRFLWEAETFVAAGSDRSSCSMIRIILAS